MGNFAKGQRFGKLRFPLPTSCEPSAVPVALLLFSCVPFLKTKRKTAPHNPWLENLKRFGFGWGVGVGAWGHCPTKRFVHVHMRMWLLKTALSNLAHAHNRNSGTQNFLWGPISDRPASFLIPWSLVLVAKLPDPRPQTPDSQTPRLPETRDPTAGFCVFCIAGGRKTQGALACCENCPSPLPHAFQKMG